VCVQPDGGKTVQCCGCTVFACATICPLCPL
jgi:hypothetical protein